MPARLFRMLTVECGQLLELRDIAWDVGLPSLRFGALCFMQHYVSDNAHDTGAIETHASQTNQRLANLGRPLFSDLLLSSEEERFEDTVFSEVIILKQF